MRGELVAVIDGSADPVYELLRALHSARQRPLGLRLDAMQSSVWRSLIVAAGKDIKELHWKPWPALYLCAPLPFLQP